MTASDDSPSLRLDEIVLAAASLDTSERTAYLQQLTQDHPSLVEQARRLLAAASEVSESFLAEPAGQWLDSAPLSLPEDATETPVPAEERYVLGELLGRGGMAEVYRAHDHQLDRPVALKLLAPGDPVNLSRCLREARGQARVRHDHVLDVYDTGELNGRPFIALRLVEGTTLGEAGRSLSLEQQVALLAQAAEGLDAAHLTGLVHRDVKPSNVLVEEAANGELKAWVSDFGIATAATAATDGDTRGTRHLVGTVAYLAPERLDPETHPDRRGDVWSFGVMMYQLFTGVLPFDGPGIFEQMQGIRRHDLKPPRHHLPSLPPDLEAIVLKCLTRDPAERYPTARELAADLRRFLVGDVVEAHAATLAYRLTRFTLRHRGWMTFAAVATVALMTALAVAGMLGWRAMHSERQASIRRGQAEDLIHFMLIELRDKVDRLGRLDLIDDIGSEAMQYFAAVPAQELSDEELARYGTALHQIGEVRMRQGDLAAATQAFAQSLALAQTSHDRHPANDERLFDLGQSQFWVGYGYRELGDYEQAQQAFEAYLGASQELVERDPRSPRWRLELGYAHSNLGTLSEDRGDLEGARERFRASLEIKEQLARESPEDADLQDTLAWAHNILGVVLATLGESEAARRHLSEDLAIRQRLVEAQPLDATFLDNLAVSHNYLGFWHLQHGLWATAADHFRDAVDIYQPLVRDDPDNAARQLRLAINRTALGRTLIALDDHREGFEQLQAAQRFLTSAAPERVSGHRRRELAVVHYQLARYDVLEGNPQGARQQVDTAIAMLQTLVTDVPDDRVAHQRLSAGLLLRGDLQAAAGSPEAARESWQRAAALVEPFARDSRDRHLRASWAQALLRLERSPEASQIVEELRAAGFCEPSFPELCPPSFHPRVSIAQ